MQLCGDSQLDASVQPVVEFVKSLARTGNVVDRAICLIPNMSTAWSIGVIVVVAGGLLEIILAHLAAPVVFHSQIAAILQRHRDAPFFSLSPSEDFSARFVSK